MYHLYYLEEDAASKVNKSKLKIKQTKGSETIDFTIPFKLEIQNFILNAHAGNSSIGVKHNGINSSLDVLFHQKIYWVGKREDLQVY